MPVFSTWCWSNCCEALFYFKKRLQQHPVFYAFVLMCSASDDVVTVAWCCAYVDALLWRVHTSNCWCCLYIIVQTVAAICVAMSKFDSLLSSTTWPVLIFERTFAPIHAVLVVCTSEPRWGGIRAASEFSLLNLECITKLLTSGYLVWQETENPSSYLDKGPPTNNPPFTWPVIITFPNHF